MRTIIWNSAITWFKWKPYIIKELKGGEDWRTYYLEILRNFMNKTLQWKLTDQKFRHSSGIHASHWKITSTKNSNLLIDQSSTYKKKTKLEKRVNSQTFYEKARHLNNRKKKRNDNFRALPALLHSKLLVFIVIIRLIYFRKQ